MGNRKVTLDKILSDQGYGTRKECVRLIRNGAIELAVNPIANLENPAKPPLDWRRAENPNEEFLQDFLWIRWDGKAFPCMSHLYLALHKTADTECSQTPTHHASVYSLLPALFRQRGIQAVGRLDADTTGLLFFTDDGSFNHFLTSPKRHVAKTYRVGVKHPITADQVARLEAGVDLRSEDEPTLPAKVQLLGETSADMILEEGRYHQVKRMFAAVGNRVESIHRIAIGPVNLEVTLEPGAWRFLSRMDLDNLKYPLPS